MWKHDRVSVIESAERPTNGHFDVVLDGKPAAHSFAFPFRGGLVVQVESAQDAETLLSIPIRELASGISELILPLPGRAHELLRGAIVRLTSGDDAAKCDVLIPLAVNYMSWAMPWTPSDLFDSVRKVVNEARIPDLHLWPPSAAISSLALEPPDLFSDVLKFHVTVPPAERDGALQEVFERWLPRIATLIDDAIALVETTIRKDALVTFFRFPRAVSTGCQQYLLYFVQFLRDLGIEATAEIKEEAQRVLFSVTPSSGPEALERIQAALAAYLSLPSAPDSARGMAGTDIALVQLDANVLHLRSQLALAGAVLEVKNATIEAQAATLYAYRQLRLRDGREELQFDSAGSAGLPSQPEPMLGGTVAITPYEGKGITVNLPEILRKLKRRFGTP